MIFAAFGHLPGEFQIIVVEGAHVVTERHIARADLSVFVRDNGVHRQTVIFNQLFSDRQHVKFLHSACRPADAVAHQHIEFQSCPSADSCQSCDIDCLEKRHHRHRSPHPELKCVGSGSLFGIHFFHTSLFFYAMCIETGISHTGRQCRFEECDS